MPRPLSTARSFLFTPGNDERKLTRALAGGADVVIADLEDAVPPAEKPRARELACDMLGAAAGGPLQLVRVNAAGSAWFAGDVEAAAAAGIDGVVLPKATAAAARELEGLGLPVVAIVESATGLRGAYELASVAHVEVLMLGAVDLGLELGLEPRDDALEIVHARSALVVDSAAAGLRAPIDRVWTAIRDSDGLAGDCALARSLGFRGKACVHPDQVAVINAAFAPSADELARARELVTAFEREAAGGRGAVSVAGEMVDLPVVERARRMLRDDGGSA